MWSRSAQFLLSTLDCYGYVPFLLVTGHCLHDRCDLDCVMPDFHMNIYFPNAHQQSALQAFMQSPYVDRSKVLLEDHLVLKYMFDPFLKHRWAFLFIKQLILSGDSTNLEKINAILPVLLVYEMEKECGMKQK